MISAAEIPAKSICPNCEINKLMTIVWRFNEAPNQPHYMSGQPPVITGCLPDTKLQSNPGIMIYDFGNNCQEKS